jgi:hypothetical protein
MTLQACVLPFVCRLVYTEWGSLSTSNHVRPKDWPMKCASLLSGRYWGGRAYERLTGSAAHRKLFTPTCRPTLIKERSFLQYNVIAWFGETRSLGEDVPEVRGLVRRSSFFLSQPLLNLSTFNYNNTTIINYFLKTLILPFRISI